MHHGNDREDIKTVLDDVDQRVGPGYDGRHWTWYSFPQTWGSTALGFGGIGGQAITTAQTYVVLANGAIYVYFGSRFAYVITGYLRHNLEEYLNKKHFPSVRDYKKLEEALQADGLS